MKKAINGFIAAIILVVIAFVFQNNFTYKNKIYRYEQHKEAAIHENSGNALQGTLVTHLPIISIQTNGQKIPGFAIYDENSVIVDYEDGENGEEKIIVDISIYDDEDAKNTMSNSPTIASKAWFNIRGNTSRAFSKSSYKIEWIDEKNQEKEVSVMGMPKAEEWALYAPFIDKTMLRNYMWMNISANIMGYAPNVRFCECYIDGEYKGVFVMMETIEQSNNRVNISNYDTNDRVIPYILKMDTRGEEEKSLRTFSTYSFHLDDGTGLSVLYPNLRDLTEEVKTQIAKEISKFERSLYSYDFQDSKKGYKKYIDVDSWVDYYIIQEFLVNNDMSSRSTYLYKDKGDKLKMGPVWDFNNVCDNYLAFQFDTEGFEFAENKIWYNMLLRDEEFVRKVQRRYKELRKTYLNEEYLIKYIDDTIAYLGDSIDRNYEIWGYTFKRENQIGFIEYLYPVERNPQSYEEAVEQYKNFLIERGKWLDDNIDNLAQYSHPSRNKLYVE